MMLLTGASPAPSADSGAKAAGLTQHIACAFEHVPLNPIGWPATTFARRLIVIPMLGAPPTATVSVAVKGDPLW